MSDIKKYEEENTELFKFMLEQRFFIPWRMGKDNEEACEKDLVRESALELFITPTCNQRCEYCYLVKYHDLYPPEINNREQILHNLNILLDWVCDNEFFIHKLDLFSGEIWEYQFGRDVLEIIYQHILRFPFTDYIELPTNCSFLRDKAATGYIERYIKKFQQIGVKFCISISVDGKIIEDWSRPYADGTNKNDDFYETMFLFAKHHDFGFHPMVASCNVKYWIENYKWWQRECAKYGMSAEEKLMMLEVRNDDWTEESIAAYNEFMNFLIDNNLSIMGEGEKGKKIFFKDLLTIPFDDSVVPYKLAGYVPFVLTNADTFPGCTVANTLTVRLGDLAICPCHRTAYPKYLYGRFIVKDDKIVDIEGRNTQMMIRIVFANNNLVSLGCDHCPLNDYCMKGCHGAQIESTDDPFLPSSNVCWFFKEKFINLLKKYDELGFFEYCNKLTPYSIGYPRAQALLKFKKEVYNYYGLGED